MKTILVPTDFSDHALFALKVAASIARKINAKIYLVHNFSIPYEGFDNAYFYEDMNKKLKSYKKNSLTIYFARTF